MFNIAEEGSPTDYTQGIIMQAKKTSQRPPLGYHDELPKLHQRTELEDKQPNSQTCPHSVDLLDQCLYNSARMLR